MRRMLGILVLIFVLFSLSSISAYGLDNGKTIHEWGKINIHGEEQLIEFVSEGGFPGDGTPNNPYRISVDAMEMVLGNLSSNVVIENFSVDKISMFNVSNIVLNNSNEFFYHLSLSYTHNIKLLNIITTSDLGLGITIENSSNVVMKKIKCTQSIGIYVKNVSNMFLENTTLHWYGELYLKNVKNATVKDVNGNDIWVEDSNNIHISNMVMPGDSDEKFHVENSHNVEIEKIIQKPASFRWNCLEDVTNITFQDSVIYGDFRVNSYRESVKNITLKNMKMFVEWPGVSLSGIRGVTLKNIGIFSSGNDNAALNLLDDEDVNITNLSIVGKLAKGIYSKNTSNVKIEDLHVAIDFIKYRDEYIVGNHLVKIGGKHISVGVFFKNGKNITIEDSYFEKHEKFGVFLSNTTNVLITGNHFSWEIENPIGMDGNVRYLVLHENTTGGKYHPEYIEILIIFFLFLVLIITGEHYKRKIYSRKATEEYYRRLHEMEAWKQK